MIFCFSLFNIDCQEAITSKCSVGGGSMSHATYQAKGYTHSQTIRFYYEDGTPDTKMVTKWTQKGRLFLYEKLKKKGILLVIEQNNSVA